MSQGLCPFAQKVEWQAAMSRHNRANLKLDAGILHIGHLL